MYGRKTATPDDAVLPNEGAGMRLPNRPRRRHRNEHAYKCDGNDFTEHAERMEASVLPRGPDFESHYSFSTEASLRGSIPFLLLEERAPTRRGSKAVTVEAS
jgi:hypothetical protein